MKILRGSLVAACLSGIAAGCAVHTGPRNADQVPWTGTPAESDWARVSQLAPGAEIDLTVKDARPASRYVVAADASGVVVLNTTGLPLSASTVRVLHQMAADNPRYLVAVRAAGSVVRDDVRVGRDGLFVNDRKVAELAQVVETHPRANVLEVRGPVVSRGSVPGTLLGGWLGFAIGVVPGLGGASDGVAWLTITASTAIGGYLGFRWSSHETEGVVYRAPSERSVGR